MIGRVLASKWWWGQEAFPDLLRLHHHLEWQDPGHRSLQGDASQAQLHDGDLEASALAGWCSCWHWPCYWAAWMRKQCSKDGAKPASRHHSRLGGIWWTACTCTATLCGNVHKIGPQETGWLPWWATSWRWLVWRWPLGELPGSAWFLPSVTSLVSGSLRL